MYLCLINVEKRQAIEQELFCIYSTKWHIESANFFKFTVPLCVKWKDILLYRFSYYKIEEELCNVIIFDAECQCFVVISINHICCSARMNSLYLYGNHKLMTMLSFLIFYIIFFLFDPFLGQIFCVIVHHIIL